MGRREKTYIHLETTEILAETDKAFLLKLVSEEDGKPIEIWVPKSVIEDPEDYEKGDTELTVSVADWWCEKEDLA